MTGGYVKYCKKTKVWNCFISTSNGDKHVGYGMTEVRAERILRSALERLK